MDELPLLVRKLVAPMMEGALDPAHDIHHLDRVAANAEWLAMEAKADPRIVTVAAYAHDLDRIPPRLRNESVQDLTSRVLRETGVPVRWHPRVLECVDRVADYSFRPPGKRDCSLEAQVLQDADKLDAIGAIGVARAFSFGGMNRRAMWDGEDLIENRIYTKGKGSDDSTLQHFADKLMRLTPDEFNTAAAKQEAKVRQERLRGFYREFMSEWNHPGDG
ncbi:MAG: HD domain-containing protein [Euryarchaeota archaeon]|nr:HD domain-containing protein [Euryarchaeota archaeon]